LSSRNLFSYSVILSISLVTIIPAFADAIVPSAPTNVSAFAVSPTQVNLFWNAPSGFTITSYKIDYKAGGGSYTTLVTTSGTDATKTNYSHTGLTTGVQYSYKIYAINSVGTSIASAEISVTPSTSSVGSLPGSPTGLVATPISPTQANLSWTAPSNGGHPITGYKIEYRIGGGSYAELVSNTGNTATTYSHTGMTAGQVYVYRVYAITSFGQSEKPSAETTVNLKSASSASVPGAPPSLSATAVSPTQVNLSWLAPSNNGGYQISGYKIEVKKGSTAYSTLIANTGNSTTTYSHAGLTTGTTYSYKVYAINSIGTGTASPEASATPTVGSTSSSPAPPTGLVATSASATQINLSWSAPSNNGGSPITGYKIEYKIGSSGTYSTLVANTVNTAVTYSHTGLTAGQTYTYRVSAINSIGPSNPSPEASVTPTTSSQTTTNSAPGAPTGLVAMSVSGTQINLSWSAPSNNGGSAITGYKIESKKGTGSFEVIVPNTGNAVTSYAHAGLTTGTQYYYRVYAINSIGTSGPSGESSASPKETTVPTLTGFAIAPTKIYLAWTAPSQTYKQSIGGYKIEEKLGIDSYKIINDNTGSVNSYTIDNVVPGKTYTYTVTALFAAGSSPRSNEISVTPTSTSVPPTGFSANTAPTPTSTQSKPIGTDPQSILKAQQEEVKRKAQEAREAMLKQSGKGDSEKAKALREEAKRANEKAQQDALAAKQKLIADKKAAVIKAQQEKTANQTSKIPAEATSKKPKTLEEARKLAEEAKQKALEKANITVKKSGPSDEEKQKTLDAAKAAAWEKAKKALEELKAKSQK
jgi:titin